MPSYLDTFSKQPEAPRKKLVLAQAITKPFKANTIWLPIKFSMPRHGVWITPAALTLKNVSLNYDNYVLRTKGYVNLTSSDYSFNNEVEYALYLGYVAIKNRTYLKNEANKNSIKIYRLYFCSDSISLPIKKRIMEACRYLQQLDPDCRFELVNYFFELNSEDFTVKVEKDPINTIFNANLISLFL